MHPKYDFWFENKPSGNPAWTDADLWDLLVWGEGYIDTNCCDWNFFLLYIFLVLDETPPYIILDQGDQESL
jgi:hypothetical protein